MYSLFSKPSATIIAGLTQQYDATLIQQYNPTNRVSVAVFDAQRNVINKELSKYGVYLTYNNIGATRSTPPQGVEKVCSEWCCSFSGLLWTRNCYAACGKNCAPCKCGGGS